jgi:diacylglycerol kinase
MKSFIHAFRGIYKVIRSEKNFRIHLLAILLVNFAGFYFSISKTEWIVIVLAIIVVVVSEMINSAIEYLSDYASPQYNETIKNVKDISAGSVLLAAIGSLVIGIIIFYPYIKAFF